MGSYPFYYLLNIMKRSSSVFLKKYSLFGLVVDKDSYVGLYNAQSETKYNISYYVKFGHIRQYIFAQADKAHKNKIFSLFLPLLTT